MGTLDMFLGDISYPEVFNPSMIFLKNENLSLLLTVPLLLYLVQIIYNISLHPLHKVPGPLLAQFSGIWKHVRYFRGTWHSDILALHNKYGPVVRIAPNEVSFTDVKALVAIYGHGTSARKVSDCSIYHSPVLSTSTVIELWY